MGLARRRRPELDALAIAASSGVLVERFQTSSRVCRGSARLTGKSAMWLVETQLRARIVGDSSLVLSACLGGSQRKTWLTGSSKTRGGKCNCYIMPSCSKTLENYRRHGRRGGCDARAVVLYCWLSTAGTIIYRLAAVRCAWCVIFCAAAERLSSLQSQFHSSIATPIASRRRGNP